MLEATHPRLATDVTYVAGDRVVTDPLCKPFSMGRNLFCVHSKKHMDDDPAQKEAKMATNRKTVTSMLKELNKGGKLLWIAPSGGRDRPTAEGVWAPAKFDPAAVELMRQLTTKARGGGGGWEEWGEWVGALARVQGGQPLQPTPRHLNPCPLAPHPRSLQAKPAGHLYPLAMVSGDMMPPPPATEKSVGERRLTNFVGVGVAAGPELDLAAAVAGIDEADRDARAVAVADAAFAAVCEQYDALDAAVAGREVGPGMSQPWAA